MPGSGAVLREIIKSKFTRFSINLGESSELQRELLLFAGSIYPWKQLICLLMSDLLLRETVDTWQLVSYIIIVIISDICSWPSQWLVWQSGSSNYSDIDRNTWTSPCLFSLIMTTTWHHHQAPNTLQHCHFKQILELLWKLENLCLLIINNNNKE